MISIVDILPTLIDLGGGNSEKLDLDGYSFANSIDGQNSFKRTKTVSYTHLTLPTSG